MNQIFFSNWENISRTVLISILAYACLVALLRGFGKRTLSKMNAYDLVVTVALGSVLATMSLNKSISLAEGITAMFMLIFLQYIISFISVRSKPFSHAVNGSPTLLVYKGEMLRGAMKKERITAEEVYAMARNKKIGSLKNVLAMVLETDGSVTVLNSKSSIDNQEADSIEHLSKMLTDSE